MVPIIIMIVIQKYISHWTVWYRYRHHNSQWKYQIQSTHADKRVSLMCVKVSDLRPTSDTMLPLKPITLEEKHVCESLRHGVTAHSWFAHYLWDIYEGFGHIGNYWEENSTHPTLPYSAITLKIDCVGHFSKLWGATFRNLTHFGRETCVWKSQTRCHRP